MAIEYVLEAACRIQEVYSLPKMPLLSNVMRAFINTHFFTIVKTGIPLGSRRILVTETNMGDRKKNSHTANEFVSSI